MTACLEVAGEMAQDEKLRALVLTHPKDEQEHWPRTEGSPSHGPQSAFPLATVNIHCGRWRGVGIALTAIEKKS